MKYTYIIIAICLIVFFVLQPIAALEPHFVFTPAYLLDMPWTIITSMFAHGGFQHIIFNMLVLFMFGSILENKIGSNKFLFLYLIAGILGSIGFMVFNENPFYGAWGASGAIYGIFGALALLLPNMKVYIYFMPVPMWLAAVLYAGIELFALGSADNIAHSAHLLGLVGGLAIALREGKESWPPKPPMEFWKALGIPIVIGLVLALLFGFYYSGSGV
jgi:membrane associated rhomboid family serine protease